MGSCCRKPAKVEITDDSGVSEISYGPFHNKYHVEQPLGVGAQGAVYKCSHDAGASKNGRHMKLKKKSTWAVKMVDKRNLSEGGLAMLRKEIEIHLAFGIHPQIVTMHEHISSPKVEYLVMEWVKGGELFRHIAKTEAYSEARAASYVSQLCSTMEYIHSQGVIHRDMKPPNVLFHRDSLDDSQLRICDFGLAEWLPMGQSISDGVIRGTPEFMSKEMIRKEPYGRASDVWAVGVLSYMLVCGRLPFDDPHREVNIRQKGDFSALFAIIAKGDVQFAPMDEALSNNAKDFVLQMLTRRDKRMTFAQALEHPWLSDGGGASTNLAHVPQGISQYNKDHCK